MTATLPHATDSPAHSVQAVPHRTSRIVDDEVITDLSDGHGIDELADEVPGALVVGERDEDPFALRVLQQLADVRALVSEESSALDVEGWPPGES